VNLRKLTVSAAIVLGVIATTTGWLTAQSRPGVRQKTLFYVAVPGNGPDLEDGGYGILVFDKDDDWKFLKRIPLWDYPAIIGPGDFRGISAHAETGRLYVTHHRGVAAFDLVTDKMLWHTDSLNTGLYDNGDCCDNGHVTADGKYVVAGSRRIQDRWWVLDAATGKIIKEVATPDSIGPHNIMMSPDGTRAYLAPTASNYFTVVDTKNFEKVGLVGPTTNPARTFTLNGAGTLLYTTEMRLLGFEIMDTKTGKLVERVELPNGWGWQGREFGHNTPSHGVALSPDEKEVWVCDGPNDTVHVYDNTVTPKRLKANIRQRRQPEWLIFSIDGKHVYTSNGEIFDAATKKKVHQLVDEKGQMAGSEKSLEVIFQNGKPFKVGERGGVGQVRPTATTSNQN
jgi:DNA-binding beta-propeller fold protein YncE